MRSFLPDEEKITPAPNTDGLINCLLQPGLFYLSIQKSMREEFNPLIKSCCTWTIPTAETKSIGLQADALMPSFLLAIWTVLS
ncbi:MAG TPA: hypothetical protein VIK55_19535 [Paludibacter sp.]